MDIIDRSYTIVKNHALSYAKASMPYFRRIIRFVALPYAYFVLVNWKECSASRYQVFKDFVYIFFKLRDFPDYYSLFRLWEKDRAEWKYYYGSTYNPHQRARLRKEVQRKEYEIIFEDKLVCYQICSHLGFRVPRLIGYIEPSLEWEKTLKHLFENESVSKVIIKDARGKGGRDVYLAQHKNDKVSVFDGNETLSLYEFKLKTPSIIQEFIEQHQELSKISSSINTIRTETIMSRDGEALILGAFMRFGLGDNFLDNQCAGGLSIGINLESGKLFDYAMNGRGKRFYYHPNSNFEFKNFKIPFWQKVVELSKQIQLGFPYYKLLGPDIAITPSGPVLIEINANPDHAGLEMDYGPVLKNQKIWEVFRDYDLLINKPSMRISNFDR